MDKPYDPSGQFGERSEPASFADYEDEAVGHAPPRPARSRNEPLIQLQRSPLIDRVIDNTALKCYMECPRKFYYSMVMGRRRSGPPSPAIAYGTTWHAILEAHYKTGGDRDAVTIAAVESWEPHEKPEDHRTLQRALEVEYPNYLKRWGTHAEDSANLGGTVGFPTSPLIEIPTELSWDGALHPYAGKIDRVIEWQGLYYVEDHKTTSRMGPTYFQQFDPSNQMMGYAWLAQLLTGLPIAGVRINAHCVLKTSSKFERQVVSFSQDRLREWGENYNAWVRRLEASFSQAQSTFGVDDPAGAFPMNLEACAGKYGQCTYTPVCSSPVRVRDRILEKDYAVNPWNPLETMTDDTDTSE